jgi:hypothetical protein
LLTARLVAARRPGQWAGAVVLLVLLLFWYDRPRLHIPDLVDQQWV